MSLLKDINKTAVEGLATAGWAAAGSYFIMNRRQFVEIFGMVELAEWQADAIICGFSSVVGDIIGEYGIPYFEKKTINNDMLNKLLKNGLPPAITAGVHTGVKKFGTDTFQSWDKDFLLAGVSKLTAQTLVGSMY